jgi:hypothetical protein
MRNGEPAAGIEFYDLLYEDDDFCKELGRSVLAAGKLEVALIRYIDNQDITANTKKATLGKLICLAKKHELLTKMVPALETIRDQRNYFTHNIYALFSDLIEETLIPKFNLLDSDIDIFTGRASQFIENVHALTGIIESTK